MNIKKAVIPAAGFGTRFLPATKSVPKEMMPIVDKPAIQYVIEEAVEAGIEDILIITSRHKKSIEDYFDNEVELDILLDSKNKHEVVEKLKEITNLANIHFIRQKEAKGLGHAIWLAKTFIGNEPFAVILPDDLIYSDTPCLKQMIDQFNKYQSTILGVQRVDEDKVNKYGIISGKQLSEKIFEVDNLVEKPNVENAPSNVAIVGRYIITPEIFDILENLQVGVGGEIQLTDGLLKLLKNQSLYAYLFDGKRYDTGNTKGYLEAVVDYALKREDIREDFLMNLKSVIK
ncbi:UTP--glucose-1-phosphate uridylyltransferase GalU [Sedimentibacter sp. zth1]|uniref:UTP--glucose-1-phosphate uridylyltransferase GalU n=1 Tax=Sedimentibacter sp. zth1 TaxID=2816908 RepID=UPI001A91C0AF|nr:UTP--glucose-1-phosphate uridylyltransferase GalU [Sedimentibacter sp. zth1]QSX05381.1 UTP--glucose-1-phosphate uridylyltransferase GalU [Sedimentibacter sp. zth1]